MRESHYLKRTIDGATVDYATLALRRALVPPESQTMALKSYVTATPALSTAEMAVAKAYLALFGRAPDLTGLAYWVSQLPGSPTVAQTVDALLAGVAGANLIDPDPASFVALIYYHMLGKATAEDADGQAYWTAQIQLGTSRGTVVQNILNAALGVSGYAFDTLRNRLQTLESIVRLQKYYSRDMNVQDTHSSILRVVGAPISYEEAMGDVYRLLVSQVASIPLTWGVTLTSSGFYQRGRTPDQTNIAQHRYLVWYNRNGQMMLATAYFPSNFQTVSGHRTIVMWHGGGWRQGYPERLYTFGTAFATGETPGYLVLAPHYRLTAYGYKTPAMQQDAEDFYGLIKTASFLNLDPSHIGLFGESSGGHLAAYLGATQDVFRVFALYPPLDLRGTPSVSTDLDTLYVSPYYAPTAQEKIDASPAAKWSSARTTHFQFWHGTADTLVPIAQSQAFQTLTGTAKTQLITVTGGAHGFGTSVNDLAITAAKSFFNE